MSKIPFFSVDFPSKLPWQQCGSYSIVWLITVHAELQLRWAILIEESVEIVVSGKNLISISVSVNFIY